MAQISSGSLAFIGNFPVGKSALALSLSSVLTDPRLPMLDGTLALTPPRVDLLTPVLPRCIKVREFANPKPMSSGTCAFPNPDLRSFGVMRHLSTTLTLVVPALSLYSSGNRVSGYRDSRCHVHRTFNSPISDSAESPDTCPCCLDGSDPGGKSRIAIP
jgi:hypothetical protein